MPAAALLKGYVRPVTSQGSDPLFEDTAAVVNQIATTHIVNPGEGRIEIIKVRYDTQH